MTCAPEAGEAASMHGTRRVVRVIAVLFNTLSDLCAEPCLQERTERGAPTDAACSHNPADGMTLRFHSTTGEVGMRRRTVRLGLAAGMAMLAAMGSAYSAARADVASLSETRAVPAHPLERRHSLQVCGPPLDYVAELGALALH